MSARDFNRSAGPFTILLFHFHCVPGRRFLHLGPQNLHVGPPFSPVGRAIYYFTIFNYFTISFPFGSKQEVFASRAANPTRPPKPRISQTFTASRAAYHACRLTIFACRASNATRPPKPRISQSCFCISGRQPCMSAHGFACRAANPTRPPHPGISQSFCSHLGPPILRVGSRFCMSAKRIPCAPRLTLEDSHPALVRR